MDYWNYNSGSAGRLLEFSSMIIVNIINIIIIIIIIIFVYAVRTCMWSKNKINSVLATIYFISAPHVRTALIKSCQTQLSTSLGVHATKEGSWERESLISRGVSQCFKLKHSLTPRLMSLSLSRDPSFVELGLHNGVKDYEKAC